MYQSKYTSPLVKKIYSKMYGTGTGLIKKRRYKLWQATGLMLKGNLPRI